MAKRPLNDRQTHRIRLELNRDAALEKDDKLSYLDKLPEVNWREIDFESKSNIVREIIMEAIEDSRTLRTSEKLDDLEHFFSHPIKLNNHYFPSLFYVYASWLGHQNDWIQLATNCCVERIQESRNKITQASKTEKFKPRMPLSEFSLANARQAELVI